ncbi:hypothetical protein ACO2Q2_01040 [Dyella sp. KRB-257]|uniref:hypothetical protein n=1 Tax=Dyella sp. KRB-257 TaxID=3400915 RepID=UPI003BFDC433
MKKCVLGVAVVIASSLLGGCYVSPDYGYVRGGAYGGDAYYGRSTAVYDDGYYAPGYYSPDYYGYGGYGYPGGVSIGVGTTWYGGSRDRYRHRDHDGRQWDHGDHRGDGRHAGSWSGGAHDDRSGWNGGGAGAERDTRRDEYRAGGSTGNDGHRVGRGDRQHDHR